MKHRHLDVHLTAIEVTCCKPFVESFNQLLQLIYFDAESSQKGSVKNLNANNSNSNSNTT
jgi:hypothetical protein